MDGGQLPVTTAGINIAIAIYWDDVETLKQHIMSDAGRLKWLKMFNI